jgi:hypothetical protein
MPGPQSAGYSGVTADGAGFTGSAPVAAGTSSTASSASGASTTAPVSVPAPASKPASAPGEPATGSGYDGVLAPPPDWATAGSVELGHLPIAPGEPPVSQSLGTGDRSGAGSRRGAQHGAPAQPVPPPSPPAGQPQTGQSGSDVGGLLVDEHLRAGYRDTGDPYPGANITEYPDVYVGAFGWLTPSPPADVEPHPLDTQITRDWARQQTDADLDGFIDEIAGTREDAGDLGLAAGLRQNLVTLLSERISRHWKYAASGINLPDSGGSEELVGEITMSDLDAQTQQDLLDLVRGNAESRQAERAVLDQGQAGMKSIAEQVKDIVLQRIFSNVEGWFTGRSQVATASHWFPQFAGTPRRLGGFAKPSGATYPKLQNMLNDLYRETAKVGNGSSMDAVWFEKVTGHLVGGTRHRQKVANIYAGLTKMLDNPNLKLTSRDVEIIKNVMTDIERAVAGDPTRIIGGGGLRALEKIPNWYRSSAPTRWMPWAEPVVPSTRQWPGRAVQRAYELAATARARSAIPEEHEVDK